MLIDIKFDLNQGLFNKNIQVTNLGKRILEHSAPMIDELGFELFAYTNLVRRSVPRKNLSIGISKVNILHLYPARWYWEWMLTTHRKQYVFSEIKVRNFSSV